MIKTHLGQQRVQLDFGEPTTHAHATPKAKGQTHEWVNFLVGMGAAS